LSPSGKSTYVAIETPTGREIKKAEVWWGKIPSF